MAHGLLLLLPVMWKSRCTALLVAACLLPLAGGCAGEPPADQTDDDLVASAPKARRTLVPSFVCPKDGKVRVAFFDADSTLRISKRGGVTAVDAKDVNILPFTADTIKKLNKTHLVAIVSNQGGISSGKTTHETAFGALSLAAKQLSRMGARIDYIDYAEGDESDPNRKPGIGMAKLLESAVKKKCGDVSALDLSRSQMIGDSAYKQPKLPFEKGDTPPPGEEADDFSNADRLFAENLKITFAQPKDAFGWTEFGVKNLLKQEELVAMLKVIEARAKDLAKSDAERATALTREVKKLREINGL